MNRQPATFAAKISARIAVGLGVPTTAIALLSGYQRPSNAAIISATTTNAVPLTIVGYADDKKSPAALDSELEPDKKGTVGKPGWSGGCDDEVSAEGDHTESVMPKNDPNQICYLKG